jgi:hypothetical protein
MVRQFERVCDARRNHALRRQLASRLHQQHINGRPAGTEELNHRKITVGEVVVFVELLAGNEDRRAAVPIERVARAFVFDLLEFDDAIRSQAKLSRAIRFECIFQNRDLVLASGAATAFRSIA